MIRVGLELMAIGMSGVFVFLLLLVALMHASGRVWILLDRWFPEPARSARPADPTQDPKRPPTGDEAESEIALAIAIATAARGGRST